MKHLWIISMLVLMAAFGLSVPVRAWWNPDYTLRKKITIDTTSAGGAITDPIGTTTVLIRLSGDFNFDSAKDDGGDIRLIAGDDKTPLSFHLEDFNANLGEAFVWVKVPDLKPGVATSIWLYYGTNKPDQVAPGAPDAKSTYDSDTVLVYHFTETGKGAHDASGNNNDATNPGVSYDGSIIGPGMRLDGKTPVTIKASDSLNWADGQSATLSAWIKVTSPQPSAVFFSRRDGAKDFVIGVNNLVPFIEINGQQFPASAPLTASSWNHFAVVADATHVSLYVNGQTAATSNIPLPGLTTGITLDDEPDASVKPASVIGEMDELEMARAARAPGAILFNAMEQNTDTSGKLLVVGQDEQPPVSWLSSSLGLFSVILKSVTIDGWVVIGFLAILAGVSWYVMITKYIYLNAVSQGNSLFMKQWRELSTDMTALDHHDTESVKSLGGKLGAKLQRLAHRAPLYQIYHIGSEEIRHRIADANHGGSLSAQSIQAIRASLDTGYVRQSQAIHSGLVFLTISIAGGPFIGLFGTVAGVMITFASIAATGEVNITAIAPGISAALVATMAGLAVAIPALLGYNYLMSRIGDVTSDMQIFIDEFVTKMAEFYRPSAAQNGAHLENIADDLIPRLITAYINRNVPQQAAPVQN